VLMAQSDSGMISDLVSDSISVTSSNYVFQQRMGREYLPTSSFILI
jgi:hypothetical protein